MVENFEVQQNSDFFRNFRNFGRINWKCNFRGFLQNLLFFSSYLFTISPSGILKQFFLLKENPLCVNAISLAIKSTFSWASTSRNVRIVLNRKKILEELSIRHSQPNSFKLVILLSFSLIILFLLHQYVWFLYRK